VLARKRFVENKMNLKRRQAEVWIWF